MKYLIVLALAALAQANPQYLYDPASYYKSYAVPVVKPDGFLADTPEVAAAKAAHLQEHAIATASAAPAVPAFVAPAHAAYAAPPALIAPAHAAFVDPAIRTAAVHPYYNSYAVPVVKPDGFLADTPEVAAAKAAHLQEHAIATASAAPAFVAPAHAAYAAPAPIIAPAHAAYAAPAIHADPYFRSFYSGPLAIPTVLPNGFLADTPDVVAAKSLHLSAHATATAF